MTEDSGTLTKEVMDKIPPPLFGREPTLKEVIEGNSDKGYPAHPELRENPKYGGWLEFASKMEGMVANQGIHAAGMVLSSFPITDVIPTWKNSKADRITQWDMHQTEEAGLIKFDLLVINNGDIISECRTLIAERHGVFLDTDNIPDGDSKTYTLMAHGLLSGVFQFETSKTIKEATARIGPRSVEELSDISSLIRPGPYSAGFLDRYIDRDPDPQLPEAIRDFWADTRGVLIYQEQLQRLFVEFCNYSPEESDAVRRIVGKKKPEKLAKLEPDFMERFQKYGGFSEAEATYVWGVIMGCGDYLFNKSHGVCYSYTSYVCAYLKANYPLEFFTALMSVRSRVMQPKLWASKAPEYIQEAKAMGISVRPPSVQHSYLGFTIDDNTIYFGLNGIRGVGKGAAEAITRLRKTGYESLEDFVMRANSKINAKTMESLTYAGAFDSMGYKREEVLEALPLLLQYKKDLLDYYTRKETNRLREIENTEITKILDRRNELRGIARRKRDRDLTIEEEQFLLDTKGLRLHRLLQVEKPELSVTPRYHRVPVSVHQVIEQAEYIGCFLGTHPVRTLYPHAIPINKAYIGCRQPMAGQICGRKDVITRKSRQPMCFLELTDGTAIAEITVFPRMFQKLKRNNELPTVGDLALVTGKVESEEPTIKMILNSITVYRKSNE